MSAMTFSTGPGLDDNSMSLEKLRAKFGPLAIVLALHALLFYFIYSGLLSRIVDATIPQAVLVTFVAPPKEAPPPAMPKAAPLAPLQPPLLPQVPLPVIELAAAPNVISVTPVATPVAHAPPPAPVVASTPAPASSGGLKTITTGVEYIQAPILVYPKMSLKMGEQGKVVLRVLINESGKASEAKVQSSSGSARLDEAGRQAAMRALYKPQVEDGRPVPVFVLVQLNFQLAT
ncbi:MAG: energy transducer TonB [Pseudomonadota bacterium]